MCKGQGFDSLALTPALLVFSPFYAGAGTHHAFRDYGSGGRACLLWLCH